MRVIRMMHPVDGKGVYTSQAYQSCIAGKLRDTERHPTPGRDSLLLSNGLNEDNVYHYHFGFLTWEQFRSWFYADSVIHGCFAHGFKLYVLEVDGVKPGHAQCVYPLRNKAETILETTYYSMRLLEYVVRKALNGDTHGKS